MAADSHNTACHAYNGFIGSKFFKILIDITGIIGNFKFMAERFPAVFFDLVHFVNAHLHLFVKFFFAYRFFFRNLSILCFFRHSFLSLPNKLFNF